MKKYITIFLVFVILMSATLTACKKTGDRALNSDSSSQNLSFAVIESEADIINENNMNSNLESSENKVDNNLLNNESKKTTKPHKDVSSVNKTPSNSEETSSNNESVNKKLTYAQYLELTPEKREEYYKTFDSVDAFIEWHKTAKDEYEENDGSIHITGDGNLNLEDYF